MKNFLFWSFPKMAGAQKGKFPFRADSRVLVSGNYFCMGNSFGKFGERLTRGVYWSVLTGLAGLTGLLAWLADSVGWLRWRRGVDPARSGWPTWLSRGDLAGW